MKIIENCWEEIMASECVFGAHIFENSTAKIYVHDGLAVGLEMGKLFCHMNDDGFAGPCILAFYGVSIINMTVSTYEWQNEKPAWRTPVRTHHEGNVHGDTKKFGLAGSLLGFLSWADIEIEAQKFELHILGKDEPGR